MGLNVSIYRDASNYDCTMRGISGSERGHRQLCLVNIDGGSEPTDDTPAAMLVQHNVFGPDRPMVRIVPAVRDESGAWVAEKRWTMFGGNYAAMSGNGFSEAVSHLMGGIKFYGAVAIHDRIEG